MRIDLNLGKVESLHSGSTRRSSEGTKDIHRTGKQDEAVLSSGNSSVAKLTTAALSVPEVRTERVTELRNSIQNGSYSVEPGVLADAILNDTF